MALYNYRAKKGPQDIIEGKIEAQSETEAIEKINQMGCLPIHIEKYTPAVQQKPPSLSRPLGKVKSREITIFSRQLASLLKSGVPILDSLNIISEQTENANLKSIIYNIHNAVKDGATVSSTLGQYPEIFTHLYIAVIRTGEDSGALHQALLRISDYSSKQERILSRFRMALAYPILMAVVGLGTVVFMLTFVMPRLMKIFVNMGQDLPLPTRILISTSSHLRQWWFWAILILASVILVIRRQIRTKAGKSFFSLLKLHIPVFGNFILKAELGRFSRTLGLLIKSGISILKAIDTSIPVVENEIIRNKLRQSYKELEGGGSFGRSLKNSKLIPVFMSNLVIVGEESGKLHDALTEVADLYERDTEETMRVMTTLLEPLMILGMGLIVGFIVVAMLLPIFEINVMAR